MLLCRRHHRTVSRRGESRWGGAPDGTVLFFTRGGRVLADGPPARRVGADARVSPESVPQGLPPIPSADPGGPARGERATLSNGAAPLSRCRYPLGDRSRCPGSRGEVSGTLTDVLRGPLRASGCPGGFRAGRRRAAGHPKTITNGWFSSNRAFDRDAGRLGEGEDGALVDGAAIGTNLYRDGRYVLSEVSSQTRAAGRLILPIVEFSTARA